MPHAGADLEAAVADFDPLAHAVDAEPAQGVPGPHDPPRIKPAAVVADGHFEPPLPKTQGHLDLLGPAVLGGIAEGLLHDAVKNDFKRLRDLSLR